MRTYALRNDVEKQNVLGELENFLLGYGLRLRSVSDSTLSIERNGEKIGYVWYNTPSDLRLEVTSPEGLDVKRLETELYERFEKGNFLYKAPKIPKDPLIPIEVMIGGKRFSLPSELPIKNIVEELYNERVGSKNRLN